LEHLIELESFSDFDYAALIYTKAHIKNKFTNACKAISSRSELQECTSLLTTKARYIFVLEAAKEVI
jgi:hypothetical protein